MKRTCITLLVALGLSVPGMTTSAVATSRSPRTSTDRAAILRAALPYIKKHSAPGLEIKVKSVTVSPLDPTFAGIRITASVGPAVVLLRKLENGPWWPISIGSAIDCAAASSRIFSSLKLGCEPPANVNVQSPPSVPSTTRWSTACGTVPSKYSDAHFRVYITFGKASCAEARRIVPLNTGAHGWTYWDWTKGGNHPWSDVYERNDASAVVTAIVVLK
jgi:hypothetical protein